MFWALPVMADNNHDGSNGAQVVYPVIVDPAVVQTDDHSQTYKDQYKDAWQGQNAFQNLLANADFASIKNVNDIDLKQVNILKDSKVSIGNASAKGTGGYGEVDSAMSAAAGFNREHGELTGSSAAATDASSGLGPANADASSYTALDYTMTTSSITGIYGVTMSGASVNVNQAALNTITAVANTAFNQGR